MSIGASVMSSKAVEKSSRKTGADAGPDAGPDAVHPLDSWLKRELQGLDGAGEGEALPADIAELAARLEDKLRGAGRETTDAPRETTREETAGPDRTSPRRGRKR